LLEQLQKSKFAAPARDQRFVARHLSFPIVISSQVAWTYEAPFSAVSAIQEYLAFYPDRVDAIEIDGKG